MASGFDEVRFKGDLFSDGKDANALRTIGEVTRALGIRQHVLRYWEDQFPMLKPVKRSGGRRYYRPEDIALIVEIDRMVHREGYTLRGARQAIEAGPPATRAKAAPQGVAAGNDGALMDGLRAIRANLAAALEQA